MPECAAARWITTKIEDTATINTSLTDLSADQRFALNIKTAISCAGFGNNSPALRLGPLLGTHYAGAAPALRSRHTAFTSCAGANGFVTRTLLGTPIERHVAAPPPVT